MKVWDLHCDTLSELRKAEHAGRPKSFAQNDLHIDLEKLQKGDYLLQCFAAFVNLGDKTPGADPLVTALEEIDQFKRIMAAYPEKIAPVYTAADIRRNAAAGKISGMLTIEEGACCKGSVGVLRRMYELGARMMTLTWNHENELASPQRNPGGVLVPQTEKGLTGKGFEFLAEMALWAWCSPPRATRAPIPRAWSSRALRRPKPCPGSRFSTAARPSRIRCWFPAAGACSALRLWATTCPRPRRPPMRPWKRFRCRTAFIARTSATRESVAWKAKRTTEMQGRFPAP